MKESFADRALCEAKKKPAKRADTPKASGVLFCILLLAFSFGGWGYGIWRNFKPEPQQTPASSQKISASSDLPPKFVTINSERWEISETGSDSFYGATDCPSRIIWYNSNNIQTSENSRNTLWHEILHAAQKCTSKFSEENSNWVLAIKSVGQDSPNHRKIEDEADFLAVFVHDNPEFMKWAENWRNQ